MKVLFVTQYGMLAASSRTRVFQYLPYLQRNGIQTRQITVLPDSRIAGSQVLVTSNCWSKLTYYLWASYRTLICGFQAWWKAGSSDLIFVQKVIFPLPVRWLLWWRRPPMAFDFDDAIFSSEVRRPNWLSAWKQRRNAIGLPAMLRLADQVIVENDYTARYALRYCDGVSIITGPVDTDRYCEAANGRAAAGEVVLGWIGSASTQSYLNLIREPLARIGRRFDNVRLRLVGAEPAEMEGIPVEFMAWSLEEEVGWLRSFDVGLMPVPDDSWTRGKGGYKLLQYMATGLPVVASPVGINRQIVSDGKNGFWACSPDEWERCLSRLIEDPRLRREMGRQGRETIEKRYALKSSCHLLLMILREMAHGGRGEQSWNS